MMKLMRRDMTMTNFHGDDNVGEGSMIIKMMTCLTIMIMHTDIDLTEMGRFFIVLLS